MLECLDEEPLSDFFDLLRDLRGCRDRDVLGVIGCSSLDPREREPSGIETRECFEDDTSEGRLLREFREWRLPFADGERFVLSVLDTSGVLKLSAQLANSAGEPRASDGCSPDVAFGLAS